MKNIDNIIKELVKQSLRRYLAESNEESHNKEYYKQLLSSFTWHDVDFIEGDIEADNCERIYVTVKNEQIPVEIINLKAQSTLIGWPQLHIFIDKEFQGMGIATKLYVAFIHIFGGIYSGFKRVMNIKAISKIYEKLGNEPDITVNSIKSKNGESIGIEAVLNN